MDSPSTIAIKTAKGKAPATPNNKLTLGRKDSGSPSNSRLKQMASMESEESALNSRFDAQISTLERTETGGATLGIKESDEKIDEDSEEEEGLRKLRRSGRSSRRSDRAEGSAEVETRSRPRRAETEHQEKRPATKSRTTPLTKAALALLPDRQSVPVKPQKKDKEKPRKPEEIKVTIDHKRKALVRRGVYDDGTKPWKDRFGNPDQDLIEVLSKKNFYKKAERHLGMFF